MLSLIKKIGLRRAGIALAILVAGGVGLSFAFAAKPDQKAKEEAAASERPVLVRKVTLAPGKPPRVLVGTLRARVEGDQGFRVAGKIAERRVQPGDRVKAGGLLAMLDATDLRLQREAAEAELIAAKSAESQASAELQRVLDLRKKGWSTEQALDRAKATRDEATGRRTRAERQFDIAANNQSYSELRAETDGIITQVNVEAGQVVSAGQPVLRIARDGDREALVALPEQALAEARESAAEASLWSGDNAAHKAQLRELAPSADPATRTFAARFVIAGLAPDAPLGMTVTLRLVPKNDARVARVPLAAILNQGNGTEVFVFNAASGTLERRAVTLTSYDAREAIVSTGLTEGDLVVTLGIHKLQNGQKVRVLADARGG